jgi:hypothetical protein
MGHMETDEVHNDEHRAEEQVQVATQVAAAPAGAAGRAAAAAAAGVVGDHHTLVSYPLEQQQRVARLVLLLVPQELAWMP